MTHTENLVFRGHDWAVAAWSIMFVAIVLGLVSSQTSQLFGAYSQLVEGAPTSPPSQVRTVAERYDAPPMMLTIPFAVTRTQRMTVATVKHRAEFANRVHQFRSTLKNAPGLLAGLAVIGASQSPGH
jgi:hypothetical protein